MLMEDASEPPHPPGPLSKKEIKARIEQTPVEEIDLASCGFRLRFGALSQRGYYPDDLNKANQDAYQILRNFDTKGGVLFGVFDGHGKDGDLCSGWCRDGIEAELLGALRETHNNVRAAFKRAFYRLNAQLREQTEFDAYMSGTTAICTLFQKGEMHVANVGDSRAIIGERRGEHMVALPLSQDQTPYRKDERERCKQGGAVIRSLDMIEGLVKWRWRSDSQTHAAASTHAPCLSPA